MLDQEAMQIARKRLSGEASKRYHFFHRKLQRVQSRLAIKGLGHGGALIQAVADVCAKEIEDAADRLWEVVQELLQETKGVPSDEAVRTLYGQIDELWIPYCSAEPERQFEAICQREGVNRPVINATNFYDRINGTRLRIQSEVDKLVMSLRNRVPVGFRAYWVAVFRKAYRESEFSQPWKIWGGVGTTGVLLLIQYFLGIRNLKLTMLFLFSGLATYVLINLVAFVGKVISIPPRRSS